MACPHVAGVAAMILSHFPDLSSEEITARLLGTTEVIATQNPSYAHLIGSGGLNASYALTHEEHPAIVFGDYAIVDDSLGNGNQVLDPGETASLSVMLKNLWADATDVHATLWSANQYVTVTRSAVDYGDIASGQTQENTVEPFEVQLSSAAPPDTPVEFSLNISTGEGYTRLLGFVATNEIRLQRGDWPKAWGRYEQPIPYDIDGDGLVELILKRAGIARIYKPDGSIFAQLGDGLDTVATVLVGDLQRDGHVEIIAVRIGRYTNRPYLSLWDKNGDETCPAFHPEPPLGTATMVLSDLDGDDDLEIILGGASSNGFTVQSIDWVGSMLETRWVVYPETPDWPYSHTRITVGDIDAGLHGSGASAHVTMPSGPELLFAVREDGSEVGQLYAVHSDGQVAQGWPVPAVYASYGPVLADLTGDGNLEVIFYGPPNALGEGLYVWDHAGNLQWTATSGGGSPVIADLDGDGDLEVLTQTTAFHHDGTPTGWYYNVRVAGGASVGDIDSDGDMEVLIGGAGGDGLRGFHYDGTPIDGFPLFIDPQHKHTSMTPVLADLDRDGDVEVTITGAYFAVWDLYGRYDRARVEWGMYRHDPYRTNCYNPDFNLPPVWYAAPEDRIVVRTETTDFYIQATDPEGEPTITYEVLDAPAGAQYGPEGSGLRFTWQPQTDDPSQDVTFCATDEDGERIAKTVRIAVVNVLIDMDGDGDMDLKDYQRFWGCCRGPAVPLASPICGKADVDNDNNVDLKDFAEMQIGLGTLAK